MRRLAAVSMVVTMMTTAVVAEPAGQADAAPVPAAPAVPAIVAPRIGAAEDLLPPGARQVLAVVRIFRGVHARNQVYREARGVQGDLRSHTESLIATADRQLADRRELGLDLSQQAALYRARLKLKGDLDAALAITEDEKRAAKYGFESQLVRELGEVLIRVPRVRRGLERTRAAVEDLKGAFDQARVALEGGNPVTALVADARAKLDRVERLAQIGSLVNGEFGRRLNGLTATVRTELDKVDQGVEEALGATNVALGELGAVTTGIDESLAESRRARADLAAEEAVRSTLDRIWTPRGEQPERDVLADAIARDALTAAQRNAGVAAGVIEPGEFRNMRDRVQAAMLGRSLERIGEICGRLVGALRRAQLDAAEEGDPAPTATTPCTLFGDPETLQEFLDAERSNATPTTTAVPSDASADATNEPEPTEWHGEMTLAPDAPDWLVPFGPQEVSITRTPGANEFSITMVIGTESVKDYALSDEAFLELGTFDPNVCTVHVTSTFEGTGELVGDAAGLHIEFQGTLNKVEERVSCTLEELDPFVFDPVEHSVWVIVTETGIEGTYNYQSFSFDGAPTFSGP